MKSRVPRGLILAIIIVIVSLGPVFIRFLDSFNGFDHPNGSVDQDIDTTPLGNYINSTVIGNGNETNRDHETEVDLPTGYVVGNIIDIELKTGMSVLIIEDTSEKASIRFTATYSGYVTTLALNAFTSDQEQTILFGIQADVNGIPTGTWLGSDSYGSVTLTKTKGFVQAKLFKPVKIVEGEKYHIVASLKEEGGQKVMLLTFPANSPYRPLNISDSDSVAMDKAINTLTYKSGEWTLENKWPVFAVEYEEGGVEGQPYSLSAPWVINEDLHVGQKFIPSRNYKMGSFAFVVGLQGEPTDKLYYEIRDGDNNVIMDGVFATAENLSKWKKWVSVDLPEPVTLKKDNVYRLLLNSPGTSLENSYRVYGHEFSYDYSIGYGSTRQQLTLSHNGGISFSDSNDADAVFKIIVTE